MNRKDARATDARAADALPRDDSHAESIDSGDAGGNHPIAESESPPERERKASPRKRVTVMASGRGSNLEALLLASESPDYPAAIASVICDNPEAGALGIAERHGVKAVVAERRSGESRAEHEARISEILDSDSPDIIALAGYMRILSADFVRRYRGRIINIHPSLLPDFPGRNTHERALASGADTHGATVHFVTEGVDQGPIIARSCIAILPEDDLESLAERTLEAEHILYPRALAMVAEGNAVFPDSIPTEP